MNYATDRRDRASRNRHGLEGLWRDYREALPRLPGEPRATRRLRTTTSCDASPCCTGSVHPIAATNHALLGRTLCSLGWNRHAIYHYCVKLENNPRSSHALGDYVQMVDLAGWPEISLLAMIAHQLWSTLHHGRDGSDGEPAQENPAEISCCRCCLSSSDPGDEDANESEAGRSTRDEINGERAAEMSASSDYLALLSTEPDGDCGCGSDECGRVLCAFPAFLRPYSHQAIGLLEEFVLTAHHEPLSINKCFPMPWSAHEIHRRFLLRLPFDAIHAWCHSMVPKELRIALTMEELKECEVELDVCEEDAFHEALRMLLIKLLYQTLPLLSCAVLVTDMDASKRQLPPKHALRDARIGDAREKTSSRSRDTYKSHAAFSTLIQALVLGRRTVKPSRRHSVPHYHVPVWDALHAIDQRRDYFVPLGVTDSDTDGTARRRVSRTSTSLSLSAQWRKLMLEATEEPHQSYRNHGEYPTAFHPISYQTPSGDLPPFYLIGDSHVLSLAWQKIQLPVATTPTDSHHAKSVHLVKFRVVPVLVTGLKAYHCRADVRYFTRTRLLASLKRLRGNGCRTIAVSAGEIDCREGLGGTRLAGYKKACLDVVPENVDRYLTSLQDLLVHEPTLEQILVLPVAPHVDQTSSRVVGQDSRRQTMREWNENLRSQLPRPGLFLVDYVNDILDKTADDSANRASYCLRGDMAADSTHMNASFARSFEKAIVSSGCDASLLL